ncbi:MAG: hypothetical protein KKC46_14230 [Proteobacteria bacterium]|nr:hypothetical protein [Pseudomonadota bacterium]
MILNKIFRYLILCALPFILPALACAENLSEIPAIKFQVSKQSVSLVRLSDIGATEIVANKNIALINSGRSIRVLKANSNKIENKLISALPHNSFWYGPVCVMRDSFVIAVTEYPEEQRSKEINTHRGGFKAGPSSNRFIIITPSSPDRYIKTLKVSSRPPLNYDGIKVVKSNQFSAHVQSCAWDGNEIYFGSYGSFGKANFEKGTIDLVEEDEGLAFNRFALLVERKAIWVGIDEGGMGGAFLEMKPLEGESRSFSINTENDIISFNTLLRHRGLLLVGTSHGLFMLNEASGKFQCFDFGESLSGLSVSSLVSCKGLLWVFIGGEWLTVDIKKNHAVHYINTSSTKLSTGIPFGNGWILGGVSGVWKCQFASR